MINRSPANRQFIAFHKLSLGEDMERHRLVFKDNKLMARKGSLPQRSAQTSNFLTTSAEFFDPNPMQLQSAFLIADGRDCWGT